MLTRASDLTNNLADKLQMGYVTSIPGPNADQSFTVAAIVPPDAISGAIGLQLTGAVLPVGWLLSRYRARVVPASDPTSNFYAAIKWGDNHSPIDPSIILLQFAAFGISPGDSVLIEAPSCSLHDFNEAAQAVNQGALRTYGLFIQGGNMRIGTMEPGPVAEYAECWISEELGATLRVTREGGQIAFGLPVVDEGNVGILLFPPGVWGPSSTNLSNPESEFIFANYSTFAVSDLPIPPMFTAKARRLVLGNCAIQSGTISGGEESSLIGGRNIIGLLLINSNGPVELSGNRIYDPWGLPGQTAIDITPQSFQSDLEIEASDNCDFSGIEPANARL